MLPLSVPPSYVEMLVRDGHQNVPGFLHASAELLRDTPLAGRRVLEIGSGRGMMAILMALQGPSHVVSMEPELVGATSGVIADQRRRVEAFGLTNMSVEPADFNTWTCDNGAFDVIVSRSSLNHLYATDKHALRDRTTFDNYVVVASKIHRLLSPGGTFIATDACRYAFFTMSRNLGVRRPWRWKRTGVDWRHHQNPATWAAIFRKAGFRDVTVHFPVPYRLRAMAPLVDTAVANFFLKGSFILRAVR